jgi:hypothetical protein
MNVWTPQLMRVTPDSLQSAKKPLSRLSGFASTVNSVVLVDKTPARNSNSGRSLSAPSTEGVPPPI